MDENAPDSAPSPAESREQLLSAILASDLAMEITAEFDGRRSNGWDVAGATRFVLEKFHPALTSEKDGPVLLLALAALQLRESALQGVIRDSAIDLIETGEAENAYLSEDFSQRKAVGAMLEQFAQLLSEVKT
jgi:hypothetical protein